MADDEKAPEGKATLMHPHDRSAPGVPYWFTRAQASAALEQLSDGELAAWIHRHRAKWLPADDSPPITIPLTSKEYAAVKKIVGELPKFEPAPPIVTAEEE